MIDHIGLEISDYARSRRFYAKALAPLGITLLMEHEISGGGFGVEFNPFFWVKQGEAKSGAHVAFASENRDDVDAFYQAAIAAGGTCNGPPARGRNTIPTTTVPSSRTRMATMSKWSATRLHSASALRPA